MYEKENSLSYYCCKEGRKKVKYILKDFFPASKEISLPDLSVKQEKLVKKQLFVAGVIPVGIAFGKDSFKTLYYPNSAKKDNFCCTNVWAPLWKVFLPIGEKIEVC